MTITWTKTKKCHSRKRRCKKETEWCALSPARPEAMHFIRHGRGVRLRLVHSSWPDLFRPSTSCLLRDSRRGCGYAGMTWECRVRSFQLWPGMPARVGVCPLLNLRRDLFQDSDESFAVASTDDTVEIAFMPARAARHCRQHFLSSRS